MSNDKGYSPKDIGVYVMYGLPGQTVSEVLKSMEFVNSLGAKIYLTEYSPIPGTKDWENAPSAKILRKKLGMRKAT